MNTIKIDSSQEDIKLVIDDLLDQIDWKIIREVMLMLGWKWANFKHGDMRTPLVDELRETASRLMLEAIDDNNKRCKDSHVGTGGIVVRTKVIGDDIKVEVSFELDSADNYN